MGCIDFKSSAAGVPFVFFQLHKMPYATRTSDFYLIEVGYVRVPFNRTHAQQKSCNGSGGGGGGGGCGVLLVLFISPACSCASHYCALVVPGTWYKFMAYKYHTPLSVFLAQFSYHFSTFVFVMTAQQ